MVDVLLSEAPAPPLHHGRAERYEPILLPAPDYWAIEEARRRDAETFAKPASERLAAWPPPAVMLPIQSPAVQRAWATYWSQIDRADAAVEPVEPTLPPTYSDVAAGIVCFTCTLIGLGSFALLMAVLVGR